MAGNEITCNNKKIYPNEGGPLLENEMTGVSGIETTYSVYVLRKAFT